MKRCYIVGAGEFFGGRLLPTGEDIVIAADGGYSSLEKTGIKADLFVGDFDSLKEKPTDVRIISHPSEKDDTDMALCAEEGEALGCESFYLFGGTGGARPDHTLANYQLLLSLERKGFEGVLFGERFNARALCNGTLVFPKGYKGVISVFCMGERARGVYLDGLKYPLSDATLYSCRALGVSNEFTHKSASVRVDDGSCLVMWEENRELSLPHKRLSV